MYLKITQYCNMTCEHCCMNSGTYGKHMPYEMAIEALDFIADYTDRITIGGGEPTTHPRFFEILRKALERFDDVFIITNGSDTNTMLALDALMSGETYYPDDWGHEHFDGCRVASCECVEGVDYDEDDICQCRYDCECQFGVKNDDHLGVALSQDVFHDPIDQRIIDLWKRRKYEIRDVSNNVVRTGRAKLTHNWVHEDKCVCNIPLVTHTGKIRECGCDNAKFIGDIRAGFIDGYEYRTGGCRITGDGK